MARLDQDAAGRLLEGTGDRAPREMTVRMATSDRTRLIDRSRAQDSLLRIAAGGCPLIRDRR